MNTKPNFSRKQNIAHRALVLKMLWVHHTALARVNTLALWRMEQSDILRGNEHRICVEQQVTNIAQRSFE